PYDGWSRHPGSEAIVSTAADMCAFAHAVWSGNLLTAASQATIEASDRSDSYGWNRHDRAGHKAMGAQGRAPGFGASLDYVPDSRTCVAILTNTSTHVAEVMAPDLAAIALGSPA